jgi:hypothetical protein
LGSGSLLVKRGKEAEISLNRKQTSGLVLQMLGFTAFLPLRVRRQLHLFLPQHGSFTKSISTKTTDLAFAVGQLAAA